MRSIFISTSDLQIIYNCSYSSAWRKLQLIKDTYEKKPHQGVTIREFCDYAGITEDDFNKAVK